MEPCDGSMEPCGGGMEPWDGGMEPWDGGMEPCDGGMEPCGGNLKTCNDGENICWKSKNCEICKRFHQQKFPLHHIQSTQSHPFEIKGDKQNNPLFHGHLG